MAKQTHWKTAEGEMVAIVDMDDSHLKNTIAHVERLILQLVDNLGRYPDGRRRARTEARTNTLLHENPTYQALTEEHSRRKKMTREEIETLAVMLDDAYAKLDRSDKFYETKRRRLEDRMQDVRLRLDPSAMNLTINGKTYGPNQEDPK